MMWIDFIFIAQGVDSTFIDTHGFGEEETITSNMNSDGRKKFVV